MHRMASLYGDNVSEFVPERWEDGGWSSGSGLGSCLSIVDLDFVLAVSASNNTRKDPFVNVSRGFCSLRGVICYRKDYPDVPELKITTWN